ncbi:Flavoprotein [Megasphaera sp. UPII 135-E]|nr:Flavoprotein [Megasphaera sp. UPII 135-E]
MLLENKHVVLAVTGGIAAFKAASITSLLRKQGAEVKCIMTAHATEFITPLTLREISGNPVATSLFGETPEFNVEHISLARWADIVVVAPATANIIGKIANGIADDLVSTVIMATQAPILLVPAMNSNMYANEIVQANLQRLSQYGYLSMEPDSGYLACGIEGKGRMPEPVDIIKEIEFQLSRTTRFTGKKLLLQQGELENRWIPCGF